MSMTADLRATYSMPVELRRRSYVSRLSRDLSWLLAANVVPLPLDTVLDVGSGPNPDIVEITRLTDAGRYICVDPELRPGSNAFISLSGFRASPANDLRKCLVIIRSTLHHLMADEQREVFVTVASLQVRSLHLLLVEDSPAMLPQYAGGCLACSAAQTSWNCLSEIQRFELLQINDLWTNCIAYGRDRADLYLSFRAEQAWITMVESSGFDIRTSFSEGFYHERLHCVPSFRLTAELRFPALPLVVSNAEDIRAVDRSLRRSTSAISTSLSQDVVEYGNGRAFEEPCSFVERCLPYLLQAVPEFCAHARRDMGVDASHARHLVAHPLGLEDVADAEVIKAARRAARAAATARSPSLPPRLPLRRRQRRSAGAKTWNPGAAMNVTFHGAGWFAPAFRLSAAGRTRQGRL